MADRVVEDVCDMTAGNGVGQVPWPPPWIAIPPSF